VKEDDGMVAGVTADNEGGKMPKEKEAPKKLSRREFVKGAAMVAGAGALAGCAPAATPAPVPTCPATPECPPAEECAPCLAPGVPETWDEEVDVVVLGAGMAGSCAAIEAADAGAKVLVLEKASGLEFSSTAACAGYISGAGTKYQQENVGTYEGVLPSNEDTPDLLYEDVLQAGLNDPELVRIHADNAGKSIDWLMDELGMEVEGYVTATLDWQRAMRIHNVVGTAGSEFVRVLSEGMEDRDTPILFETPAKRLITDAEGAVIGVEAESGGETKFVRANATVVCTGTYAGSPEMVDLYEPQLKGALVAAPPADAGDGLRMAAKLGAVITHTGITTTSLRLPSDPQSRTSEYLSVRINTFAEDGGISVNLDGKRWVNEDNAVEAKANLLGQPETMFFLVFDEEMLQNGPLGDESSEWVRGLDADRIQEELEKGNCIKQAQTIRELADQAGIDADKLEETVAQYNGYVDAGQDLEYGRNLENVARIESPPFYAMICKGSANTITLGGLHVNTKCQVEDVDGEVIPGLYAAGGPMYPKVHGKWALCGHSISSCCTFGRIAGQNAAAEAS
jgi:flavocytochrome c